MAFQDRLRRLMSGAADAPPLGAGRDVPGDGAPGPPRLEVEAGPVPEVRSSDYDRTLWHRKLKSLLDRLPDSEPEWADFLADGAALGFEPAWMARTLHAEFEMLVRNVVADRVVTEREAHQLERARVLIGLGEDHAAAILDRVVAEVEEFFGEAAGDAGAAGP